MVLPGAPTVARGDGARAASGNGGPVSAVRLGRCFKGEDEDEDGGGAAPLLRSPEAHKSCDDADVSSSTGATMEPRMLV